MIGLKLKSIYRNDTNLYTLKDLEKEVKECLKIIKKLGLSNHMEKVRYVLRINDRATKYLGLCTFKSKNPLTYIITINGPFLKVAKPQDVHDTIMHEVLHTLPGCMDHGEKWQNYASIIEKYEPCYTISRLGDCAEYKKLFQQKSKYIITCKGCGHVFYYQRRGRIVNMMIEAKMRGFEKTSAFCPYCKSKDFDLVIK